MGRRAKVTVYVLHLSDGRKATARRVGDRPPVVRIRYRGVGSGRPLRSPKRTELEHERDHR